MENDSIFELLDFKAAQEDRERLLSLIESELTDATGRPSGESIKTSIRVKTRLSQMTEAGLYTGGTVPYGYHLRFVVHSPSAYSNSVRSVKVSGRLNIASFRKVG